MIEFPRENEIASLLKRRDNGKIKVVTGLRRCGKSFLLFTLFKRRLLSIGVKAEEIAELNVLEAGGKVFDPASLAGAIGKAMSARTKVLLLDEIQLAGEGFQRPLLSLLSLRPDIDCYVTGSNSRILSKDIVKLFKGKANEVRVSPLSLAEIRERIPGYPLESYLRFGGIPLVLNCETDEAREEELRDLWENTYLQDINERFKGRLLSERTKKEIVVHILSNLTSPTSERKIAKRIAARMHPSGEEWMETKAEVMDLVQAAQDSFLLIGFEQRRDREDPRIETPLKNYCVDLGLLRTISESASIDADVFENAAFLRLRAHGYAPYGLEVVCADGSKSEVDFVYEARGRTHLVQVAYFLTESNSRREIGYLAEQTRACISELVCHDNYVRSIPGGIKVFVGKEFFR